MLQILLITNLTHAKPVQIEGWKQTPELRICWNSQMEPVLVREALSYLSEHHDVGLDINNITITTNNFCGVPRSLQRGAIYIDNYEVIDDILAKTRTNATLFEDEKILPSLNYAYIQYPNALLKYDDAAFILAHELGHAFGLEHDDTDHLMKTYY